MTRDSPLSISAGWELRFESVSLSLKNAVETAAFECFSHRHPPKIHSQFLVEDFITIRIAILF